MRIDTNIEQLPESRWVQFEFTGTGPELFKIWFGHVLLGFITLGISTAWSSVRLKRYFYTHTLLDGSEFDYHGKPIDILKSRVAAIVASALAIGAAYLHPIAGVASVILLALSLPWFTWQSIRYDANHTSYRDVNFNFSGRCSSVYYLLIVLPLIFAVCGGVIGGGFGFLGQLVDLFGLRSLNPYTLILSGALFAIFLAIPTVHKRLASYKLNHSEYGKDKFRARLDVGYYYWTYCKLLILASVVAAVGCLLALMAFVIIGIEVDQLTHGVSSLSFSDGKLTAVSIAVCVSGFFALLWLKGYTVALLRNHSISRLQLQSAASFRSVLHHNRLFQIKSGNFFLVIITLGFIWPWAKIRITRYLTESVSVRVYGDAEEYVEEMRQKLAKHGDESNETFNLNMDVNL